MEEMSTQRENIERENKHSVKTNSVRLMRHGKREMEEVSTQCANRERENKHSVKTNRVWKLTQLEAEAVLKAAYGGGEYAAWKQSVKTEHEIKR